MFKLYICKASAPERAVEMTAEILQLDYESQTVDLFKDEQFKPEYLEINPAHTVPFLEEDGFYLADSHAIITYLVSKYADEEQSKLYPKDLKTRAIVNQRMFFEATILSKAYVTLTSDILLKSRAKATPQQIKEVKASYEILEMYLKKSKFVACDHVTVADILCVANVNIMDFWVPLEDNYPKVKQWLHTLQQEDWYKKAKLRGLKMYETYYHSLEFKERG